jgi:hypothetical protein
MITATLPKPENASWGVRIPDYLPSPWGQGRARDNITASAVMSVRNFCVQKKYSAPDRISPKAINSGFIARGD